MNDRLNDALDKPLIIPPRNMLKLRYASTQDWRLIIIIITIKKPSTIGIVK